jgi:uncharacterized protein (DUF2141 family)
MKLFYSSIIGALLVSGSLSTFAQHKLVVKVKNIKQSEGTVRVALFNSEDTFLDKAFQGKSVKANGSEVSIEFADLPAGEYALSVFHDANDNGELDKNFMGIPREGFGFGNNAMGTFGPPSFEKAKFKLSSESTSHEIVLKFM